MEQAMQYDDIRDENGLRGRFEPIGPDDETWEDFAAADATRQPRDEDEGVRGR